MFERSTPRRIRALPHSSGTVRDPLPWFRANNNDTSLLLGMSFGGVFRPIRAAPELRQIMARRPTAFRHLDEFDRLQRSAASLQNSGYLTLLGSMVSIVLGTRLVVTSHPGQIGWPAGIGLAFGGVGGLLTSIGLFSATEYQQAESGASLLRQHTRASTVNDPDSREECEDAARGQLGTPYFGGAPARRSIREMPVTLPSCAGV